MVLSPSKSCCTAIIFPGKDDKMGRTFGVCQCYFLNKAQSLLLNKEANPGPHPWLLQNSFRKRTIKQTIVCVYIHWNIHNSMRNLISKWNVWGIIPLTRGSLDDDKYYWQYGSYYISMHCSLVRIPLCVCSPGLFFLHSWCHCKSTHGNVLSHRRWLVCFAQ